MAIIENVYATHKSAFSSLQPYLMFLQEFVMSQKEIYVKVKVKVKLSL
jgi:hypothetical protein